MKTAGTLLALSLLHLCSSAPISRPTNWLRQCRASISTPITALEVLPGGGWDNLRNMDMGRVMNMSYFQCQTTEDGIYLIPDEVFVIPHKKTHVETISEIISSWQEQKSSTANSINADVSFYSKLNAKFSQENLRMKTHQVKDSSTTARVQIRNLMYRVQAYPDFTLDIRFVQQVNEIASAIENNQTRLAKYLSEKMVLDYGTHVITSVDAGAALVSEDYLSSSYVSHSTSDRSSIKAQAGLNFFDKLKFDISSNSTQQSSLLQTYRSKVQYSLIQSHGGIPFYPGITLQKWQESIKNNLVAIDRSGLPLHFFINTNTLPDLPQPTIEKVSLTVSQAIEQYYKINMRPGCVDVNSKNFNFQANVDDSSCEGQANNLNFGGVYQQCVPHGHPLCHTLDQRNPDTGYFSCRHPYTPTLLRSEVRHQSYTTHDCYDELYPCGFLGLADCDRQVCEDNHHVRSAHIKTYWCSANGKAPDNSGYLFGGIYSPSLLNPLTNAKRCPQSFIPVKFLYNGQVICLSKDFEAGRRFAVPFGGLFSCQSSNPLANSHHRCPPKFSQHLASVSDGCEILYCVQSGLFTGGQLLPVHLPPFTKPPLVSMHGNNTVLVMTEGDKRWVRGGQTNSWKLATQEEIKKSLQSLDQVRDDLSLGEQIGLVCGGIGMVMLLVVVVVVVLVKRRRRLSGFSAARGDEDRHEEAEQHEEETVVQQDDP